MGASTNQQPPRGVRFNADSGSANDVETRTQRADTSLTNASILSPGDALEPRYIREGARTKPRVPLEADRLETDPVWLPPERPNVRMHNEPDLPLPAAFEKKKKPFYER